MIDDKYLFAGQRLTELLSKEILHETIVEGLLYRNSSLLCYADPGFGKSVLGINMAVQMALGISVFESLKVIRPFRIWYWQNERDEIEPIERLQRMLGSMNLLQESQALFESNFLLDLFPQSCLLTKHDSVSKIIERGQLLRPDVIFIDPLYPLAPGLSQDEVGSIVSKYLTTIKRELGCAIVIWHHNVKHTYEIVNGERHSKDDPFYGSIWLKAHCTGAYLIKRTDSGTHWINKKDSHSNLLKEFSLIYDQDSSMSCAKSDSLSTLTQIKSYLNSQFKIGRNEIVSTEIMKKIGVSRQTLVRVNVTGMNIEGLTIVKSLGKPTLYRLSKEI